MNLVDKIGSLEQHFNPFCSFPNMYIFVLKVVLICKATEWVEMLFKRPVSTKFPNTNCRHLKIDSTTGTFLIGVAMIVKESLESRRDTQTGFNDEINTYTGN